MHIFIRALCTMSLFCLSLPVLAEDFNFKPWSDGVFIQLEKEYGKDGAARVRKLHDLMVENRDKPTAEKLRIVNDAVNKLPWIADRAKYHVDDYWATPMETVATFGGDCEDMAIAKFLMLRLMGVPRENLRLTYVKIKKTGEAHMILAYIENPDRLGAGEPVLVLDNQVKQIKPADKRKDLLGVYLVDADRNMTLISDDGKRRSVKAEVHAAKLAKLDKIKKKLAENRNVKYKQYNDGRPLY